MTPRWAAGLLAAALGTLTGASRAETRSQTQYWAAAVLTPLLTGEKLSSPGLSGWLDLHARRAPDRTVFIVRPGLGYRLTHSLSAHVGYAWIPAIPDDGESTHEHRLWQQGLWQGRAGIVGYQLRPRLEQRFRQGQDGVGHRVRFFGRANLRFLQQPPLDVALWDELFLGLNETGWNKVTGYDQNRAFAGLAWTMGATRLEAGYLNVHQRLAGGHALVLHNVSVWLFASF